MEESPPDTSASPVFVKEKVSPRKVSDEALVPDSIGGVATDVEEIGEISTAMFTGKFVPTPGGVSIGSCLSVDAGTPGCLVARGGQLFILSNNHVVALVNAAPLNTPISQPGRLDGGVCPKTSSLGSASSSRSGSTASAILSTPPSPARRPLWSIRGSCARGASSNC